MIPSGSPVALRLGQLAEAARTGSLDLSGDSGGAIYLSAGDIVAADSERTPSLAARTRAEPAGSLEWTWLATEAMPLATLMAEVTRRHRLLEQIAAVLTPDAEVTRNLRLRSRAVHVSDSQWAILMRLGQPVTPRDLALELGQSVFGTTIEVYRMVIMDLVSVADAPARPAEPDGDASRIRAGRIGASRIGASRIGASRIWPALSFIRALT